jgi:hypothetical protein
MMASRPDVPGVDTGRSAMFGLDLLALLIIGFLALVAVVLVVLIVFFSVTAARRRDAAQLAGVVSAGGMDPQLQPGPPATAIEARLRELDDLRARGVISYDEYVAARQRAIEGRPAT